MTLIAKPIVDRKYWILQQGNQKVGNVEACAGGYQVKINNQISQFKTIKMLTQRVNIQFEPTSKTCKSKSTNNEIYGYPVKGPAHKAMQDVRHRLPVYTKTNKSKSWHAAGWYLVQKGRTWTVFYSPKMILLQRYPFKGPFTTEEQASEHAHSKIC